MDFVTAATHSQNIKSPAPYSELNWALEELFAKVTRALEGDSGAGPKHWHVFDIVAPKSSNAEIIKPREQRPPARALSWFWLPEP